MVTPRSRRKRAQVENFCQLLGPLCVRSRRSSARAAAAAAAAAAATRCSLLEFDTAAAVSIGGGRVRRWLRQPATTPRREVSGDAIHCRGRPPRGTEATAGARGKARNARKQQQQQQQQRRRRRSRRPQQPKRQRATCWMVRLVVAVWRRGRGASSPTPAHPST